MPVSPQARLKIINGLSRIAPVDARSMFGGVGLYSDGLFFGLIANDILYFKVDDSNRGDYETEGMGPFCPYGPGSTTMQYYRVPEQVFLKVRNLKVWMEASLLVARRASQKKAAKKKRIFKA